MLQFNTSFSSSNSSSFIVELPTSLRVQLTVWSGNAPSTWRWQKAAGGSAAQLAAWGRAVRKPAVAAKSCDVQWFWMCWKMIHFESWKDHIYKRLIWKGFELPNFFENSCFMLFLFTCTHTARSIPQTSWVADLASKHQCKKTKVKRITKHSQTINLYQPLWMVCHGCFHDMPLFVQVVLCAATLQGVLVQGGVKAGTIAPGKHMAMCPVGFFGLWVLAAEPHLPSASKWKITWAEAQHLVTAHLAPNRTEFYCKSLIQQKNGAIGCHWSLAIKSPHLSASRTPCHHVRRIGSAIVVTTEAGGTVSVMAIGCGCFCGKKKNFGNGKLTDVSGCFEMENVWKHPETSWNIHNGWDKIKMTIRWDRSSPRQCDRSHRWDPRHC